MRHRHSMHEPRPVYAAGPTLDFEDDGKWQEIISMGSTADWLGAGCGFKFRRAGGHARKQ